MREIPTGPTRQQMRYEIQRLGSSPALFPEHTPRRERRAYARWMRKVQNRPTRAVPAV